MFRASGTGRSNRRRPEVISRSSRVSASRLVGHAALAASVVLVVPLSGAVVASASTFRTALGHGGAKTGNPVATDVDHHDYHDYHDYHDGTEPRRPPPCDPRPLRAGRGERSLTCNYGHAPRQVRGQVGPLTWPA